MSNSLDGKNRNPVIKRVDGKSNKKDLMQLRLAKELDLTQEDEIDNFEGKTQFL